MNSSRKESSRLKTGFKNFQRLLLTDIRFGPVSDVPAITISELQNFAAINHGGLPVQECVKICFQDSHKILLQLEEGTSFAEVIQSARGKGIAQLHALLQMLDLKQALEIQQALQASSRNLEKRLAGRIAYPLFLMAFSLVMILFFSANILPAMSMYSNGTEAWWLNLCGVVLGGIWIVILLFGLCYLLSMYLPFQIYGLQRLVYSLPLIRRAHTYGIACLLEHLCRNGLSTRKALETISLLPEMPFASRCAGHWMNAMEKGISLIDAVEKQPGLDPEFILFFKTGIQGSCLHELLKTYQNLALNKMEGQINKLSLWIQLLSYGCVGALMICVYQIMFTPLSMLETF